MEGTNKLLETFMVCQRYTSEFEISLNSVLKELYENNCTILDIKYTQTDDYHSAMIIYIGEEN